MRHAYMMGPNGQPIPVVLNDEGPPPQQNVEELPLQVQLAMKVWGHCDNILDPRDNRGDPLDSARKMTTSEAELMNVATQQLKLYLLGEAYIEETPTIEELEDMLNELKESVSDDAAS